MINYVNSVISVRCLQITTEEHLDSVSFALFTFISGETASSNKVVQGYSSSMDTEGAEASVQEADSFIFLISTLHRLTNIK